MFKCKPKKRYFFIVFGGDCIGNLWFEHVEFPSYNWMKEQIIKKFPDLNEVIITNIIELSEEDFISFGKM